MRTLLLTHLRPMSQEDLPQVADIERQSFTSMWPMTAYERELQNTAARYLVVTEPGGVEQREGLREGPKNSLWQSIRRRLASESMPTTNELLLGFVGLWLMVGEAHIVTFAVRESHRRMGIGERLLIASFDCAITNDQACLTLEVRESNDAARNLYAKYGMAAAGLRKRYYTDNNEDAVIMTSGDLFDSSYRASLDELRAAHQARFADLWQ